MNHIRKIHPCAQYDPDILRSLSANNSRKAPIARPLGRGMGAFREFEVWPKFCLRSCCDECNIVLYCVAIHRESIVISDSKVWTDTSTLDRFMMEGNIWWKLRRCVIRQRHQNIRSSRNFEDTPFRIHCQLDHWWQISITFESKYNKFHTLKLIWKCRLQNGDPFVSASVC